MGKPTPIERCTCPSCGQTHLRKKTGNPREKVKVYTPTPAEEEETSGVVFPTE